MKPTIHAIPTDQLATIVAGLVREGVTFVVNPTDETAHYWYIEFTGGY
jgi:hypothetical protein